MTADVSAARTAAAPPSTAGSPARAPLSAARSTGSPVLSTGSASPAPSLASDAQSSTGRDNARRRGARPEADPARVAERALRALLAAPTPPGMAVARAGVALEVVSAKLASQATLYGRLAELEEIAARERKIAQDSVLSVEQSLIEAKMAYAGVLEEKDAVSRELSLARRELAKLEAVANCPQDVIDEVVGGRQDATRLNSDPSHGPGSVEDDTNIAAEEQRIEMLELQTAADLAKLKELDEEIVGITDEIDEIQKRRKQLQKKFSEAYDDF
jgi:uncharacterized coiled-coil protein SlyX